MRLRLCVKHSVSVMVLGLVSMVSGGLQQAGAVQLARLPGVKKTHVKTHPLTVREGVLTVDGLTARTGVNLRIANLHYLYVFVPGSGTAVISDQPFAGAVEQRAAFRGNALTVTAGSKRIQLSAANKMRGTHSAFVRFEAGVGPGLREPAVSYGEGALVPAVWPEDEMGMAGLRGRGHARSRHPLRTAKLCRPSPHGHELCATVREVVYTP